jgi:hypothetical protein
MAVTTREAYSVAPSSRPAACTLAAPWFVYFGLQWTLCENGRRKILVFGINMRERRNRKSELKLGGLCDTNKGELGSLRATTGVLSGGGWERVQGSEMRTRFRDSFVLAATCLRLGHRRVSPALKPAATCLKPC